MLLQQVRMRHQWSGGQAVWSIWNRLLISAQTWLSCCHFAFLPRKFRIMHLHICYRPNIVACRWWEQARAAGVCGRASAREHCGSARHAGR